MGDISDEFSPLTEECGEQGDPATVVIISVASRPVPKSSEQLNTKDWGLWLRPRKEDLVNGSQ